ncbi:MAG TPA: FAD/NAD(P)-binding oxidoreductase [Propionibacteriaceae bacterium]|nr:FAD/NAD(P)-binding oxidoreductase [Propionibacteriaceae bacterium]
MTSTSAVQPTSIVIIGASLAGASAAVALREQGYAGELTLIGDETDLPYERPPLSKAVLLGDANEPDWVKDEAYYSDQNITLARGTVVSRIDRDRRVVVTSGAEYRFDKLLLATGSTPRRLDVPGGDLDGLHTLRTYPDSLALRSRLIAGTAVVIVGAGWIGCEVAAAARKHGASVVMIDPLTQPLVRVLGEEVGAAFAGLHRDHGVDLRLGTGVSGFLGEGRVSGVQLSDGTSVPADTVVVGIGVIPNVALAEAAGLDLANGGVAVDATLRTSDPDIYAAGDIAAHDHPKYAERVRVEHWAAAKDQGTHVAGNLLGADQPYELRPFFFSDQYDLGCEYRGLADPGRDRLVIRGDLNALDFTAFWLRDGGVTAAMNVNQWDDGDALQELVDTGRPVEVDQLVSGSLS